MKPLKLGDFELKVPIFQGGMGIGVSLSGLAGAVGSCGGVGVISAAHPGYQEPDFQTDSFSADCRALKRQIIEAKEKVLAAKSGGMIGVNIMCAIKQYEGMVRTSIEAGADIIVSGAGIPSNLPSYDPERKAKLAPIISSARAAALIIKTWKKRYDRVPDVMIFEGPEAGGHLGYGEDEIAEESYKFYERISEIKDAILKLADIPLIAGGGISDKEEAEKAFAHGADGIQIGSRFVVTEECDADRKYKQAYIDCKEEDIVIVKSPVGMPGRAIRNRFIDRTKEGRILPTNCHNCLIPCHPGETPYCITDALIAAAKGDVENGLIFCGAKAYKADKITTVQEVIDSYL